MLKNLDTALQELANNIEKEVLRLLRSQIGVNSKVGVNTLIGSSLESSIVTQQVSENELTFYIADYYRFVVSGRRKGAMMPPLEPILEWMKKKGLGQSNSLAYAIRKSISEKGIEARPFLGIGNGNNIDEWSAEDVLPFIDDFFNKWAEDVFEAVCSSLKYFK